MKNLLSVLLIAGTASLTGCSPIHLSNLKPDYHFKKNTNRGIAALSVRCNLGKETTTIYFSRVGLINKSENRGYETSFDCNSPQQPLSASELKLILLPGGSYSINNWAQIKDYRFFIDKKTSRTFNPITFTIVPGQVTYIGELQLIAGSGQNYQMQLINEAKKDLPKITKHLPLISKQTVHIKLGMISPNKIIY